MLLFRVGQVFPRVVSVVRSRTFRFFFSFIRKALDFTFRDRNKANMENLIKVSINLIENYPHHDGWHTGWSSKSPRRWGFLHFPSLQRMVNHELGHLENQLWKAG